MSLRLRLPIGIPVLAAAGLLTPGLRPVPGPSKTIFRTGSTTRSRAPPALAPELRKGRDRGRRIRLPGRLGLAGRNKA